MPIPAAPAPDQDDARLGKTRPRGPRTRASTPPTTTAAVPWMSSLNDGHAVAVAIEDPQRVRLLEVLPLDDAVGPDLGDARDERLDQLVVGRPAQPRRAMADVQRVGQQGRIVGPDIERDGQRQRRMDAARRRVQRELADRDGHAAGALVAEAQDPLVVGDDDEPDVLVRALAQELRDPVDGRPG